MKKLFTTIVVAFMAMGLMAQDSYFVAGNGATDPNGKFCDGFDWTTDASQMVESDGKFVITFEGVGAGTYKCKVVKNGDWEEGAYGYGYYTGIKTADMDKDGDDNIIFIVTEDCDVTIVFDAVSENLTSLTYNNKTLYSIAGNGSADANGKFCGGMDWSTTNSVMTASGDNASITFHGIAAGTYMFKVAENGDWYYPNYGYDTYTGSTAVTNNDGNIEFVLTETSDVTITFNGASKEITALDIQKATGIEDIFNDAADIIKIEFYSITGAKLLQEPANGIYIVKATKSNGSTEVKKVMINN